jgi:hypothetical protein
MRYQMRHARTNSDTVSISMADLELLVSCAVSYDVRLPYGLVPPRIWSLLSAERQARLQRDFNERDTSGGMTTEPAAPTESDDDDDGFSEDGEFTQ